MPPWVAQTKVTVSRTRATSTTCVRASAAAAGTAASGDAATSRASKILQAALTGALLIGSDGKSDLRGGGPGATATTSTKDLYNASVEAGSAADLRVTGGPGS